MRKIHWKTSLPESLFIKIAGWKPETVRSSHRRCLLRVRLHITETKSHPRMKKFLLTREFHPGMKRAEFHPGMKFNLKENLPLSMKTYNLSLSLKIYHWYFKTSDDYFFRKVTFFIIFVCLFSYWGFSEAVARRCSV